MKEKVIRPIAGEGVVACFSESFILDKKLEVAVPNGFIGTVFVNQKVVMRLLPTSTQKLFKLVGKDYLNQEIKICFSVDVPSIKLLWGFGGINVNNERLKEAYRVGANGHVEVALVDVVQLVKNFPVDVAITEEEVRGKLLSLLKTVGVPTLANFFVNTDVSVFEISGKIKELREKYLAELMRESGFSALGLKLLDITIDGLHVNEEDLALIRERINE